MEIGSSWGQFHWLYAEALKRGYRVGASASSDEHQGRCGGGSPATSVFGSRGGLTGVLAEDITRASVGRSLRGRQTFATTGERSFASLRLGTHWMGEVVTAAPDQSLSYRLLGDQGWESVELHDADRVVWRRDLHQEQGLSDRRIRLRLGGARITEHSSLQGFGVTNHRVQGSAQLMAHIGEDFRLGAAGHFGLFPGLFGRLLRQFAFGDVLVHGDEIGGGAVLVLNRRDHYR